MAQRAYCSLRILIKLLSALIEVFSLRSLYCMGIPKGSKIFVKIVKLDFMKTINGWTTTSFSGAK